MCQIAAETIRNGSREGQGLLEGRLGGLPTPMVMLCAGGFCSFCILFLICPNGACMQFLVLYSFFFFLYSVARRDVC